jgi:hypothetical protein
MTPSPRPRDGSLQLPRHGEQLAQVCRRDKKSVKDYRENYFKELGFSNVVIEQDNLEDKRE